MAGRGHPSGTPTRPLDGCPTGVVPEDLIAEAVLWLMTYAGDVALRSLPGWKREKPGWWSRKKKKALAFSLDRLKSRGFTV